jgi:hypothetical protein
LHVEVLHGPFAQECPHITHRVPSGATITPRTSSPALLPPEEAPAVQQADGESSACHPEYLTESCELVADEAERGDRHHQVETARPEGESPRVGDRVRRSALISNGPVSAPA